MFFINVTAMKHIAVISLALQVVLARPQNYKDAKTIWYEHFNDGLGNFKFAFHTDNGIIQEQIGQKKSINENDEIIMKRGLYSFITPDSSVHEVHYTSDENGYMSKFLISSSDSTTASSENLRMESANTESVNTKGVDSDENQKVLTHTESASVIVVVHNENQEITEHPHIETTTIAEDDHGKNQEVSGISRVESANITGVNHVKNQEVPKRADTDVRLSQSIAPTLNVNQTTGEIGANRTAEMEFPDRIGTPVLITLQGAPG